MRWPAHQDFGYYGPDSVTWKINREWIVLLGGARAVLMQIAHPLVALGVSYHSDYMHDPFGRAERTFMRGIELTFGNIQSARQAARTINNLHKHVHGHIPMDAGHFPQGTTYDARDPELLLWVHATLVDTLLLGYQTFIGPLSHAEEERYYQESKGVAHLLGLLPKQMPEHIDDLKHYVFHMIHSDKLVPTLQGRELAMQTLFPPVSRVFRPILHFHLYITNALLPQPVREIYGFDWNAQQQRAFDLAARGLRFTLPRMPAQLRELPITRRMMHGETRKAG